MRELAVGTEYERRRHVTSVYLSSPAAGELGNPVRSAEPASLLPSCRSAAPAFRAGSAVPRTDGLGTSLGSVVPATTDLRRLEQDVAVVREIEAGLIVV